MIHINSHITQNLYSLKINHIIKSLIISYVIVLAGWGLITPLIAVFITDVVPNATITTVGFAMSIYALTRCILQLPIAWWLDKKKGEKDEFYALFFGYIVVGIAAVSYLFIQSILVLYIVQIIYGIGDALLYPAWGSLFVKHVDKKTAATENSLYQTGADLASAVSASLGAMMVALFGYNIVFLIVGVVTFLGSLLIFPMYKELSMKKN